VRPASALDAREVSAAIRKLSYEKVCRARADETARKILSQMNLEETIGVGMGVVVCDIDPADDAWLVRVSQEVWVGR
jgi:hypothetical protein